MRCNKFLLMTKFKSYHDFLKYYSSGKNVNIEKPLRMTRIIDVTNFEISYHCFVLIASAKIPERKGSISPSSFYG